MSDTSQGPGWWQASDGKWYPPEQAPGAQPTVPPTGAPAGFGAPAGQPGGFATPGMSTGAPGGRATFSVGDAFNWGFKKFQENLGPILIATLIIFAVTAVIEIIFYAGLIKAVLSSTTTHTTDYGYTYTTTSSGGFIGLLLGTAVLGFIMFLGSMIVQMAVIRATLMITNGEQITLGRMFSTDRIGPYLVATILVAIGYSIGLMLCYIPGLIFFFFAFFYGWFVIDKQMGAVDSIKASFNLVNQNIGTCIGLFIASILAYIIGAILCGIGLLVAIPVVILATGYAYRRMQGEAVAL